MFEGIGTLSPESIRATVFTELPNMVSENDAQLEALMGPVESVSDPTKLASLASVPKAVKDDGQHEEGRLRQLSMTTAPEKYKISLNVERIDVVKNRFGFVTKGINQMADSWSLLWNEILIEKLLRVNDPDETSMVGYDEETLISAGHSTGSNFLTGPTGVAAADPNAPTPDEIQLALWTMVYAIRNVKDEFGRYLNRGKKNFTCFYPSGPTFDRSFTAANNNTIILSAGQVTQNTRVQDVGITVRGVSMPEFSERSIRLGSSAIDWTDRMLMIADGSNAFMRYHDPDTFFVDTKGEGSDYTYDNDMYAFGIKEARQVQAIDHKGAAMLQFA